MTPRRILLMLGGMAAFAMAYWLYARIFGFMDGLPVLPARMLIASAGEFRPQGRITSPTLEQIKESFGEGCPELDSAIYPMQLARRYGDSRIVLASGPPTFGMDSNRVTLTPCSIASIKNPRPEHLRQPGEVSEITTIHADKVVLEFDRVIQNTTDMTNKDSKLVRVEFISDPEHALRDGFKRQGRVHITHNQRWADPNRFIVMRTVGPVFYRDPKAVTGPAPLSGPDIWTDAPIEIVDRGNIPRRPGTLAATALATAEEVRNPAAIADILSGQRLPPPTLTAIGMRIYMEPEKHPAKGTATPAPKTDTNNVSTGFSGVRRIELLEKVLMNLWIDGGQGLVGSNGKPSASPEPSIAAVAVGGGLVPGAHAANEFNRALLQAETRGPFYYDAQNNLARFDVLPQSDPNLTNDVRVTKVPPRPGTQTLFSQVLELEFDGTPTAQPPASQPEPDSAATSSQPSQPFGRFKRLHAWTNTTGRNVIVESNTDKLTAYGQDLTHEQVTERTELRGGPLICIQDRSVLTAGGPKQEAVLILEPIPGAPKPEPSDAGKSASGRKQQATVLGFGRVELYDEDTKEKTTTASWLTKMVQTKEWSNDQELDRYTLTDDAKFADTKADYWLTANEIKLWLLPSGSEAAQSQTSSVSSRGLPHRLQAIGKVKGHSADMDIEDAEIWNAYIRDIPPPVQVAGPAAPMSPAAEPMSVAAAPNAPVEPEAAPKEPEKPKPPMKVTARDIDTWITRYPLPKTPGKQPTKPGEPAGSSGMKYQMDKARCEGPKVEVHQAPADPTKPRGTDIYGSKMLVDCDPEGNKLTVFGWDNAPGQVHNEDTSLIGPKIVIDQLHNIVIIEGRGSLKMMSASDLSGAELKQPEPVIVHFRDGMTFRGAQKVADFFGKVNAAQGMSQVTCHTLQVTFDRPVYLSQVNRPTTPMKPKNLAANPSGPNAAADDEKAKIDVVYCYPASADTADNASEKIVTFVQVENDPETGKLIARKQLVARELTLRAQARDDRGEPYRALLATGPGVLRIWQPSSKDEFAADGQAPKQPGDKSVNTADSEMKLTQVKFSGRMIGKDKGQTYQEATFFDAIEVIQVPTENYDLDLDRPPFPPNAMRLTCDSKLVVWSHKKTVGPADQNMSAYDNAYMQDEKHEGWGDTITLEGKKITLVGLGLVSARFKNRFERNEQAGRRIVFDRATNRLTIEGSSGGVIESGTTSPPKSANAPAGKMPPPAAPPPPKR